MSATLRQFKEDTNEPLACFGKAVSAPIGLKLPQRNRGVQANRLELGALDRQTRRQNLTTEVKS